MRANRLARVVLIPMTARLALRLLVPLLTGAFAWSRFADAEHWDLLDDVNLAIHEAGHLVFGPFGDQLQFAGGSLFQVLVPLVFAGHFAARRQRFAASVVLGWAGASLLNVARYVADARAQELPLLGGENAIHDWWYLLTEWGMLAREQEIAQGMRGVAAFLFVLAVAGSLAFAREGEKGEDATPDASNGSVRSAALPVEHAPDE